MPALWPTLAIPWITLYASTAGLKIHRDHIHHHIGNVFRDGDYHYRRVKQLTISVGNVPRETDMGLLCRKQTGKRFSHGGLLQLLRPALIMVVASAAMMMVSDTRSARNALRRISSVAFVLPALVGI